MKGSYQSTIWLVVLLLFATVVDTASSKGQEAAVVPRALAPFAPQNGRGHAIVVEKESQQLWLYTYEGRLQTVQRFSCSTGKRQGKKQVSGDQKTPEGIYFFTHQYSRNELAPLYGIGAFPLDYPNVLDRLANRNGYAIWLHGTNKTLRARDSNGCVAVKNEDLTRLSRHITLNRTPIVIQQKLTFVAPDSARQTRQEIVRLIAGWCQALASGSYHDYLSFYDPDYLPDITWWSAWRKGLAADPGGSAALTARSQDIAVVRNENIYAALFDLKLHLNNHQAAVGAKKLFLHQRDGKWRIIGEAFQTRSQHKNIASDVYPILAAAKAVSKARKASREIPLLIEDWLQAWSKKDIRRYGSFYARDFLAQGMDRKTWLQYKKRLNHKYDFIRVSQKNLVVHEGRRHSTVSFQQTYVSSAHRAVGMKKLVLKREDGQWKIFREIWKKN